MMLVTLSSILLIATILIAFFIVVRDARLLDGLGLAGAAGVSSHCFTIDHYSNICADGVSDYSYGLSGTDTISIFKHGNYRSHGNLPGAMRASKVKPLELPPPP